ncbi:MAG: DNRLRE domain-containing protein, partial [Hadesarchaea archaeon]|nr:DNRLRE domain-containing protein [Hadesarchaea archaeon]
MRAEALVALLLASLAVSLVPQISGSQPLQAIALSPTDDAEVRELTPGSNHGLSAVMWVRSFPGRDRRAFLRFDLSSLPPNAIIVEAKLHLYCQVAVGADLLVQARAVRDDGWSERKITWSNQPPHGEVLDVVKITKCHSRRWYSWDVTDFVREQFSGDGVASLCLRAAEEDFCGSDGFRSKEHGVPSTRPYLEVKYVLPTYAVAVSISPSSQAAVPGSVLSYAVVVSNLGSVEDTYALVASDNAGWVLTLSESSVRVPAGGTAMVMLSVLVPADAVGGEEDNVTVVALGTGVSGSASCIAQAAVVRSVEVLVSPGEASGAPGETLSFEVVVKNLGNVDDVYALEATDALGWSLDLEDSALIVPRGEDRATTLRVTIPSDVTTSADDDIEVKATSLENAQVSSSATCVARAVVVRGVALEISPSYQSGAPGETLSFTVRLTNTGNVDDTYTLSASDDAGWPLVLSPTTLTLAAGQSGTATLSVVMPDNWLGCTRDNIIVRALGTGVENSAACVAHLAALRGVELAVSPSYRSGLPGEVLTYDVVVKNVGNVLENFVLSASDNENWTLAIHPTWLLLWPGESGTATLSVVLPELVLSYLEDNITVMATSLEDPRVSASDSCVAHPVLRRAEVSISPESQDGRPGDVLSYVVVVKNVGELEDNISLEVEDDLGWHLALDDAWLIIPPGENGTTTLRVTIPIDVAGGAEDSVTVIAAPVGYPNGGDSAACVARAMVVYGVEVSISPSYRSGLPGSVLAYSVSVTNKGNVSDNFSLAASDTMGWRLELSPTMLEVPAGESRQATLNVAVPADAPGCTEDRIVVRAVGTGAENSAACIAHAAVVGGVSVSISPSHRSGLPGTTLGYVVTVGNTGNAADNFSLEATDELGWQLELENTLLSIPPAGQAVVQLTVGIPEGATPCTRNMVTVVARGTWAENSAACVAGVSPIPPRLLEPPDGLLTRERRPTFRWENSYAADNYELWVDDDPSFSSPLILENVAENSSSPAFELLDGSYRWRVRAYKCGEASGFSQVWTFIIDATPPSSSVDAIAPYWRSSSPLTITATASDGGSGVAAVRLYYRYSPDNSSWGGWAMFASDDSPPWSWSFNFPSGNGYYEFYSIALDVAGNEEAPPALADAGCGLDGAAPSTPALLSPAVGAWTNDNTPTLSWSAASDALSGVSRYELEVDDDPSFGSPEISAATASTSYDVAEQLREGTQHWRVRAVDLAGNAGAWASGWFRVDVTPPGKPTPVSPEDNRLDNRREQVFTWRRPEPDVVHHLQIDDEPSLSPPYVREDLALLDNSCAHVFAADGVYFWRVRARDAAGNWGAWSDAFKLTIDTLPPGKPAPVLPENNAVRGELSIVFAWTEPEPGVIYHLQIDGEPNFPPPHVHENSQLGENLYSYRFTNEGTYFWRVRARDAAGNWGEWSGVFKFTIQLLRPPGKPSLLSPPNGALINYRTPMFRWTLGTNADNHRLLVDDAADFSSPMDNVLLGATDNTWTKPLPGYQDGTYYWKVVAINAAGENSSEVRTFSVDATPPAAPALAWPADGQNLNDRSPNLDWGAVADASQPVLYRVVVSDVSTFAHENRSSGWIAADNWRVSPPLPEGVWYWRVQAKDGAGNVGGWSAPRSFRVDVTPPPAPELLEPADGATTTENRPRFRWAAVADESMPVAYRLQVDDDGDFSSPEVDASWLEDNSFVPALELPVDNYRWRVQARDNAGNVGEWSVARSLQVVAKIVEVKVSPAAARGVSVEVSPSSASAAPGQAISYTVVVKNTGEVEDSYSLAAVDTLGWRPSLSEGRLERVRPGQERKVTLSVSVPEGASVGAEDRITVIARGTGVSASATCVARVAAVAPRAGVSLEISPATKSGLPGTKLTFRVLVRNEGEAGDAFSLVVSGAAEWSPRLKPSELELAAGAMGSAELELEVPRGAEEGSSETFTVTATSSLDPSVVASASCTAVVGAAPLVLL